MKIIERIKQIMFDKGIKQIELANAVGVGKTTINAWFNNNSDPKAEQLPPIAKLLNVSLDYLITGEETTTNVPRLTADEEHLLSNYRKANDKGRARIQESAREMVLLYPDKYPHIEKHEIPPQDIVKLTETDNIDWNARFHFADLLAKAGQEIPHQSKQPITKTKEVKKHA